MESNRTRVIFSSSGNVMLGVYLTDLNYEAFLIDKKALCSTLFPAYRLRLLQRDSVHKRYKIELRNDAKYNKK